MNMVDRVYEYLPYDWGWEDAVELRHAVMADIRAHEKVALEVAFTDRAQRNMGIARHLYDVYDVLEVLVEKYPLVTVEDACQEVQARKEAANG